MEYSSNCREGIIQIEKHIIVFDETFLVVCTKMYAVTGTCQLPLPLCPTAQLSKGLNLESNT
jgi:hypothetical protein